METGMIIIAAVIFAAIVVPTLLLIQNSKKQSQLVFKGLKALADQNNGALTEHLEQNGFALGIDSNNKFIYFFKKTDTNDVSQVVNLAEVASCEIFTKTRRIRKEKKMEELIEQIVLVFNSKKNGEPKQIELFNEEDTLLTDECKVAEIWKNKVQQVLTQKKNVVPQEKGEKVFSSPALT